MIKLKINSFERRIGTKKLVIIFSISLLIIIILSLLTNIGLGVIVGVISIIVTIYYSSEDEDKKIWKELAKQEMKKRDQVENKLNKKEKERKRILSEKESKTERLDYYEKALRRKGITADYLVEKYKSELKAILITITHRNQATKERMEELNEKVVHSATKIIPPKNIDRTITSQYDLKKWFKEEVIRGKESNHKLELLTTIDLKKVYSEDKTESEESWFSPIHEEISLDEMMNEEDFLDILKRSDKISLKDEIKENVGLLLVPIASKEELDTLLKPKNQLFLQRKLGGINQIVNTPTEDIEEILSDYVDNSDSIAKDLKKEAKEMQDKFNL